MAQRRQVDKLIVKYLHERGEDPRGVADEVDSPCMEKKGRCWKIPKYHVAESHSEDVREDPGWNDKEDSGVWNGCFIPPSS